MRMEIVRNFHGAPDVVEREAPTWLTRLLPPELEITEGRQALSGSEYYTAVRRDSGQVACQFRVSDHGGSGSAVRDAKLLLLRSGYRYRDVKANELHLTEKNWLRRGLDNSKFTDRLGVVKIKRKE